MNAFFDATSKDQMLDLVMYTSSLLGDGGAFLERCKTNIESESGQFQVMKEIIINSHVYYKGTKDVESVLNSVSRLICIFSPAQAELLIQQLSSALVSVTGHEPVRLKVLGTMFNNLDATSTSRFDIFLHLLSLVSRTPRSISISVLLSELPKLETWKKEWSLTLEQTRILYKKLYDVLKACRQNKQSSAYLVKYIATFDDSTPEAFASIKNDTMTLIAQALVDPETFDFSSILNLGAVQQLKSEKIYEALSVVVAGNLANYKTFQQANSVELSSLGMSEEDLSRKVRLLTLSALCASSNEISYSTIASTLLVDEADIEMWVVEVIRVNLVEAKIDQVNRKVIISRSTHPKFDRPEWELLKNRLAAWSKHIDDVRKTLVSVKTQVHEPIAGAPRR